MQSLCKRFGLLDRKDAVEQVQGLDRGCGGSAQSGALPCVGAIKRSKNSLAFPTYFMGIYHASKPLALKLLDGLKSAESSALGE
jgi:hypothetical protein